MSVAIVDGATIGPEPIGLVVLKMSIQQIICDKNLCTVGGFNTLIYIQLSWTRCDVVTTSGRNLCAVRDEVTPVVELGLHALTPLFIRPKLW